MKRDRLPTPSGSQEGIKERAGRVFTDAEEADAAVEDRVKTPLVVVVGKGLEMAEQPSKLPAGRHGGVGVEKRTDEVETEGYG